MGASKGAGTPIPAPGRPGLLPMLADILGVPTEHIWVACGDSSCATEPVSPPLRRLPPLLPLPFPDSCHLLLSSAPWQSGCERLSLQRDSQHFAPCKERWESWHRDPASCAAPRPPPGFLSPARARPAWLVTPCSPGVPVPHLLPYTPSLYSTNHPWDRAGARRRGPPAHPLPPWRGQQMLALPFPAEEYQAAHGHRLMLPGSFWHC